MEFESGLAKRIVSRRSGKVDLRKVMALGVMMIMSAALFAYAPRTSAGIILLDEVNIGDPVTEVGKIYGWSSAIWSGGVGNGWGDFDQSDPYLDARAHNLRTAWTPGEGDNDRSATVTLTADSAAKYMEIRALDGQADDSYQVYVNGKPVFVYNDKFSTETWVTSPVPLKGTGPFEVRIVALGDAWGGINTYGQLAVNWIKLYGVGGFDMYGYNYGARLYVGWGGYYDRYTSGGTDDSWLVMKWSDDWVVQGDCPVGAWVTNHFTWFSDDYDELTFYGWDTRAAWDELAIPSSTYMIQEFAKIMRVGDNPAAWAAYEDGGAYGLWGSYSDGVPAFVVFQDNIDVYDAGTGEVVASYNLCATSPFGLGNPIF